MKKTLAISNESILKMECWTYYKMSIIQTLPQYMNWLSAHMNIYFAELGEGIYFGEGIKPHRAEYYSDILHIEEIDLYQVIPCEIIDRIKSSINDDYYFVVFLRDEKGYSHEVFIYGLDDESKMFESLMLRDDGIFVSTSISFLKLEADYRNNYTYYKNNPENYYEKSDYGYVMYRMKPNLKYINKNYAVEFFGKLYHEVYGTRTDLCYSDDYDEFLTPCSFYTGVTCLIRLVDKINELMDNREWDEKNTEQYILKKNLFKLLEHRKLIYDSMIWYEHQWRIDAEHIVSLHNEYHTCCENMNKICMVYLKYLYTKNESLLTRIKDMIIKQYRDERRILCEYVNVIREFYMSKVLPKRFD